MPRVNIGVPPGVLAMADDIRAEYDNMLTAADVRRLLGLKSQRSCDKWLSSIQGYNVNGRPRFFAVDIARKLWEERL